MREILTDVSSIEDVLGDRCIYVDKTAYFHKLITATSRLYFISRPRRFGKSLMLSTLKAIFEGRKELFEGLAISKTDYDWKRYPVIHFDLSRVRDETVEEIKANLVKRVCEEAEKLGFLLPQASSPGQAFDSLWYEIERKNLQVVVLVDEYDIPLQGFLEKPEELAHIRQVMHDFYVRLKSYSHLIRFMMMTGVSKFTKLSVFSGLNNLVDLSMRVEYAGMLGYTEDELDTVFREHIQAFADSQKLSYDEMRVTLRQWYDGYHFSRDMSVGVYNPVSIGLALTTHELNAYWIWTGGASLIVERLRKAKKIPADLNEIIASRASLEECDIVTMPLNSLLYQSGYLTIKEVREGGALILSVPNREVRSALTFQHLQHEIESATDEYLTESTKASMALAKGDLVRAIELFRGAVAELPHSWLIRDEGAAKVAFLSFFYAMPEVRVSTEKEIQRGKIDAVVETSTGVYIFEFKCKKSAQIAHDQVLEKGYAEPYRACGKPIFAIGLNYTPKGKKRGIDEPVVSQVEWTTGERK